MIFKVSRLVVLAASTVLAVSLAAPAHADPPSFAAGAKSAVTQTAPVLRPSENFSRSAGSDIDPKQKIKIDQAVFRGNQTVVSVLRGVGALRPVTGTTVTGRVVSKSTVKRRKAGNRSVLVTDSSDQFGPGLLTATWTERNGVNYSVASRNALDVRGLLRVVKSLPADKAKASRTALRVIKKAKPFRALAEPAERSAASRFVDGAGVPTDDLNDEADLCNGCSYSSSNYVGLWQWILWADQRLAASQIDCVFGSGTSSATAAWQTWAKVGSDGYVGYNTRSKAGSYNQGSGSWVTYLGIGRSLSIERNSSNHYKLFGAEVSYSYRSAAIC
ncbi:MAG: hypothetical protein ABIS86_22950 [Streptosporangiaceae bacterium]